MSKSDAAWLGYCYVALGLIATYIFYQAIYTVGVQTMWVERYDEFFPMVNSVLAVAFGGSSVFLFSRNNERREYHLSVIGEVRKVRWPTLQNTRQMTLIVVVVVAIFAAILAVFDSVWLWALKLFLPS